MSPELLDAFSTAAGGHEGLRRATADVSLVVQQVVTGGPGGDVTFHVEINRGAVAVRGGEASEPTVTFTEDYCTAAAVARGDLSAQGAFMAGRIGVSGDLPRLVECQAALSGIDDLSRSLRLDTEY
ncbi:hypothetical protein BH18ACT4_BH18ACT4_12210 [soil metagenome]